MSDFRVRTYEPGDEGPILDLFNRVFAEGNPAFVPRSAEHWRHVYLDNPAGHQILVAEDARGEIVANYSAIPAWALVRGERRLCAQAVDTCVDRAWRGSLRKGSVFVTIAKEYCRRWGELRAPGSNDYMWGLPNEQAFPVGTRIVGYRPVHCPLPGLLREVDPAWCDELAAAASGVEVVAAEEGRMADLVRLAAAQVDAREIALEKSATYLAWRYRDWPGRPYRAALATRRGEPVGALVYRLGWMGQPLLPLVDWFVPGDEPAVLAALLAHAARITLDAGGQRVETWVRPRSARFAALAALGLQRKDSPFNLCIMVYSERFDLPWAGQHWSVTMGDSDIY